MKRQEQEQNELADYARKSAREFKVKAAEAQKEAEKQRLVDKEQEKVRLKEEKKKKKEEAKPYAPYRARKR